MEKSEEISYRKHEFIRKYIRKHKEREREKRQMLPNKN